MTEQQYKYLWLRVAELQFDYNNLGDDEYRVNGSSNTFFTMCSSHTNKRFDYDFVAHENGKNAIECVFVGLNDDYVDSINILNQTFHDATQVKQRAINVNTTVDMTMDEVIKALGKTVRIVK